MGKVLKVREVGDPILEKKCEEVNIKNIDEEIIDIMEDLKATLEYGTGLGIAAPQIAVNKRIIVVGAKKENIKYSDAEEIAITAMINPTWRNLSEDTDVQYEGCMSVPNIRGKVERYKNIELTYYNEKGEKIVKQLNGFFARLVQHECDHLDGIVFLEKVKGPNGFATKENINKYNLRERNNKINIRKVKKEDLRDVSEIAVNGWKTAYRGIVDDVFLDNLSIEENYQKRLNDYTENGFIVAELNNEIVGFCRYRTGNYYKDKYADVDCEICALYVKPNCKRNGIGKELVNYVINEFKENGYFKMILWCLKDNYPSRTFYEKLGGIYCGEDFIVRGNKEYKEVGYIYNLKEY